jgi:enoyl-CoA hydratase
MANVRIEKHGAVTTVVLSRPERRNAVDRQTAQELSDAFTSFDADASAKVAVFWGEGGGFCAGADLKAVANGNLNRIDVEGDGPMGPSRMLLKKPVIAAITGHAVAGGLELALWCDLRIAALDLILTGRGVNAQEALAIGLVNRVVPKGEGRKAAEALAAELCGFPQVCMNADRFSAYHAFDGALPQALRNEFERGVVALETESVLGAQKFAAGAGRHGSFEE